MSVCLSSHLKTSSKDCGLCLDSPISCLLLKIQSNFANLYKGYQQTQPLLSIYL